MKVKTVKSFFDKNEGITRNMGDTFTVSEERYQELISTRFGVLVEKVAEAAKSEKTAKSKSTAKKSVKK
jgi:hypothetical protein